VIRRSALLSIAAAAVVAATASAGGSDRGSRIWAAALSPKPTVPKAKGAAGATGTFHANGSFSCKTGDLHCDTVPGKMIWTLTFQGLTGPALLAHIHTGKPGVAGPVLIPLCAPCRSGAHGTFFVTRKQFVAIGNGAYVNVHTKKNPLGEIRGQLKLSAVL
jgi:hypothetical protein